MTLESDLDLAFELHNNQVARRKYELKCLRELEEGD